MWCGGQDTNDHGEAVVLFDIKDDRPNTKKKKAHVETVGNATTCSIGGRPAYFPNDEGVRMHILSALGNGDRSGDDYAITNPCCKLCGKEMYMLAQINASLDELDRTLYVFACNKSSCYKELFNSKNTGTETKQAESKGRTGKKDNKSREERFNIGGGGIMRCIRSQTKRNERPTDVQQSEASADAAKSATWRDVSHADGDAWGDTDDDWDDGGWGSGDELGWGDDTTKESMDDLEAMLTACEMNESGPKKKRKGQKNEKRVAQESVPSISCARDKLEGNGRAGPQFTRFELEMYDEPRGRSAVRDNDDDDDDDDDIGAADEENDDRVQKLLSKYLQEEEDVEIIAAIQPGGTAGTGGGGTGGEKYERLPPDERAFIAFTDRKKRAPHQVARYAYGGAPLWSTPLPSQQEKNGRRSKDKMQKQTNTPFPVVPRCPCGSERSFEFQLMPSILFALDVDKHAQSASGTKMENITDDDRVEWMIKNEFGNGGMDWGVVAIYSCTVSCELSREEYVVVQESVDGTPVRRVAVDKSGEHEENGDCGCSSDDDETDS